MADIRINSLPSTATSFNTDDYIAIDGASAGTRKMLAATLPLTDVTFGTSGPSAKSSIAARAARQGLVFNGTGSGYATMGSSLGTSSGTIDIVLDIPTSNPSVVRGVFTIGPNTSSANFGNCFASELRTDGKLWITLTGTTSSDYRRAESSSSLVSLFGGKKIRLTVVRDSSASTLTTYINGVVIATVETTGGTAPAWSGSVTGTYFIDGGVSPSENYVGFHSLSGFYNRALSAAEVVALYESGVPAGADYNTASNTALNTGTALNTFSTTWTTFTGASATGFTASTAANSVTPRVIFPLSGTLVAGRRYRVKGTATYSGLDVVNLYQSNTAYAGVGLISAVSSGAFEFTFTATSGVDSLMFLATTSASGSHSLTVSGFNLDTPGLLLAPDAGQAGGGLVWYDTSGNAANITLPASGVSWNVPTSGKMATSLTIGGTGTGLTLSPTSGPATLAINGPGAGSAINYQLSGTNKYTAEYVSSSDFYAIGRSGVAYDLVLKSGNALFGTTTDSANGKLQLATHTTSAGGIGFGTDVSLYRDSSSRLTVLVGSTTRFRLASSGGNAAEFSFDNSDLAIQSVSNIRLVTNNTTALTLDSSQLVTVNKGSLAVGQFSSLTAATATFYSQNSGGGNRVWSIGTSALAGADNQYGLVVRDVTGSVNALQLEYATGNATFGGNIKTAAPSGGTAGAWKLGVRVAATTTLDTTQYLQVDIGGTLYKVALVTS